jgi:O-antigen ligase
MLPEMMASTEVVVGTHVPDGLRVVAGVAAVAVVLILISVIARGERSWRGMGLIAVLLAHIPLAIAMFENDSLSTLHALGTICVGLWWSGLGRRLDRIAYVAAYVAGADVLWRMTDARMPWEGAKYALVAFLGLGLFRFFNKWKDAAMPLFYFALLLPSAILTIDRLGPGAEAREEMSFNLAAPLALTVAVIFFAQVRFDHDQIRSIVWAITIPIVGIASIAAYHTATRTDLEFGLDSNIQTSGGFGPNQVSSALGLGALFAVFLVVRERHRDMRALAMVVSVWLLAQGVFTFSRGGVLNILLALGLLAIHYLFDPRRRARAIVLIGVLTISAFVIFPQLDQFSGNLLGRRFQDLGTTNRTDIASQDLDLFADNPVFGVGVGMSKFDRPQTTDILAVAHTEYSRLLAEHGIAGILAMIVLAGILLSNYIRSPDLDGRAWVAALAAWALVQMSHAGMRISLVSMIIGLTSLRWAPERELVPEAASRRVTFAAPQTA